MAVLVIAFLINVTAYAEEHKPLEDVKITLRSQKTGEAIGTIELLPEKMTQKQIKHALSILVSEGEEALCQEIIKDTLGEFDERLFFNGSYFTNITIETKEDLTTGGQWRNKSEDNRNPVTRWVENTAENPVRKHVTFDNGLTMNFRVKVRMTFYQSGSTIFQIHSYNLSGSGFPVNGGIEGRHYTSEIWDNGAHAMVTCTYRAYIEVNAPMFYDKVTVNCSDSVIAHAQDYV